MVSHTLILGFIGQKCHMGKTLVFVILWFGHFLVVALWSPISEDLSNLSFSDMSLEASITLIKL